MTPGTKNILFFLGWTAASAASLFSGSVSLVEGCKIITILLGTLIAGTALFFLSTLNKGETRRLLSAIPAFSVFGLLLLALIWEIGTKEYLFIIWLLPGCPTSFKGFFYFNMIMPVGFWTLSAVRGGFGGNKAGDETMPFDDKHGILTGWPKTQAIEENGQHGFLITAKHLTPKRAAFFYHGSVGVASLMVLGALPVLFFALAREPHEPPFLGGYGWLAGMGLILTAPLVSWLGKRHYIADKIGQTTTTVRFLGRHVFFNVGLKKKYFSLDAPHSFEFQMHDRAQEEEKNEQYKPREKHMPIPMWYRFSRHVIFRYAGQRVDIAEVFGESDAEQFVMRLQLVDGEMQKIAAAEAENPDMARTAKQTTKEKPAKKERQRLTDFFLMQVVKLFSALGVYKRVSASPDRGHAASEKEPETEPEQPAAEEPRQEEPAGQGAKKPRDMGSAAVRGAMNLLGLSGRSDLDCDDIEAAYVEKIASTDEGDRLPLNAAYRVLKKQMGC